MIHNIYKKKIVLLAINIFFIFGLFGCTNNRYIKNLCSTKKDFNLLIIIPVKEQNNFNDVCISNTALYYNVYKKYYTEKYRSFCEFINGIYKKNIIIVSDSIKALPAFKINNSPLLLAYNEKGFDYIKENYLTPKKNALIANNNITKDEYYGLIKIMFEREYYIIEDDYSGELRFYKNLAK